MTSLQVVSGHRKNFKGTKFNCKKLFLNITLKTISLLLLRGKKNPHTALCSGCRVFFQNRPQGGKLFSLLKDSGFFLALPPLTQGREKSLLLFCWILGEWKNGKIQCATLFPSQTVGNPWLPQLTGVIGQQYREERKRAKKRVLFLHLFL